MQRTLSIGCACSRIVNECGGKFLMRTRLHGSRIWWNMCQASMLYGRGQLWIWLRGRLRNFLISSHIFKLVCHEAILTQQRNKNMKRIVKATNMVGMRRGLSEETTADRSTELLGVETLCQSPRKHTQRIVDNYTRLFGEQPRTCMKDFGNC